ADGKGPLRERIGVQLQHTSFPDTLAVGEILDLFRSFYPAPLGRDRLLRTVGLEGRVDARPGHLSGGERQRLALATALVGRPDLLILDEPTAGLDPGARRSLHDLIRDLRRDGRTILLTTHYTDEAEKLCDRVLMLRNGEMVADGSPLELVSRARGESRIWVDVGGDLDAGPLLEAGAREDGREGPYRCFTTERPARAVEALGIALRDQGLELQDLRVKRPTLEDVYLELMGDAEGGVAPDAEWDADTPGGPGTDVPAAAGDAGGRA
ncbi:MAG: ABC transporter ATP-binding protein, partial [Gemmatimonadota bacterium]